MPIDFRVTAAPIVGAVVVHSLLVQSCCRAVMSRYLVYTFGIGDATSICQVPLEYLPSPPRQVFSLASSSLRRSRSSIKILIPSSSTPSSSSSSPTATAFRPAHDHPTSLPGHCIILNSLAPVNSSSAGSGQLTHRLLLLLLLLLSPPCLSSCWCHCQVRYLLRTPLSPANSPLATLETPDSRAHDCCFCFLLIPDYAPSLPRASSPLFLSLYKPSLHSPSWEPLSSSGTPSSLLSVSTRVCRKTRCPHCSNANLEREWQTGNKWSLGFSLCSSYRVLLSSKLWVAAFCLLAFVVSPFALARIE
jgi:hypothetical protein